MPGFFRTHLLDHMHAPPEENRLAHQLMDNSGHDADEAATALLGYAPDALIGLPIEALVPDAARARQSFDQGLECFRGHA